MVTEDEIKKLVIARLMTMPEHLKVSIGGYGMFDKYALISHVEKNDEIGKKIIEMDMHYLKSFKKGDK